MVALLLLGLTHDDLVVRSVGDLRLALRQAEPGATITIASGQYDTLEFFSDLHGAEGRPIVVKGADPMNPPRFKGWQLSRVSHLRIEDVEFKGSTTNGLNIDDGSSGTPSRHIALVRIRVSDLPKGNHDGIKLSGVEDFTVRGGRIERWGGSGIDLVGCHRGTIEGVEFAEGGDNGVQAKGGSSNIVIRKCRFEKPGQRGVNLGGSTGLEYFRPKGATYEAKNLTVEGCVFVGGVAAVAFVGVDGATVRFNTILRPERWVVRILQETTAPGFVPSRKGRFEDNLIVFDSGWAGGGVNVGGNTAPETFRFDRNHWHCADRPGLKPRLPTVETGGVYDQDPRLDEGMMKAESKAGAHRLPPH